MLDCFKKNNNANDIVDEICIVYGNDAIIITTICNWFKIGNFDLKDEDYNDYPAKMNTDFIKVMFAENPRYSMQDIMDTTNISTNVSRETVDNHLR